MRSKIADSAVFDHRLLRKCSRTAFGTQARRPACEPPSQFRNSLPQSSHQLAAASGQLPAVTRGPGPESDSCRCAPNGLAMDLRLVMPYPALFTTTSRRPNAATAGVVSVGRKAMRLWSCGRRCGSKEKPARFESTGFPRAWTYCGLTISLVDAIPRDYL